MLPLQSFLFALLAALLIGATPSPEPRDLLGEVIDALGIGLVTHIDVTLTLATLDNNLVTIDFEAQNPLLFELTIDSVSTTAGLNGTTYAAFDHKFTRPVVVPPLSQANSGNITNVLLTQGATASLAIIPFGVLDLLNVDVNVRAGSLFGIGGVPLVISGLHQSSVPTT
ncbi:hypothetical protein MVEN_02391700 [Mycena venus]|uniref:Late embryogenesis abundant protein LEA-2 subgroup domain-containing protein n=1 Tax=Mycena venus TaxID=2733690 RepID=A0A8H6X1V3_9AGAR|nr:hypothetical protein MVEN_02391700 [Mycena venus]